MNGERRDGTPAVDADLVLLLAAMVVAAPVALVVWAVTVWWLRGYLFSRWWPAAAAVVFGVVCLLAGAPATAAGSTLAALQSFHPVAWTLGGIFGAGVGVLGRVAVSTAMLSIPVGLAAAAVTNQPQAIPGAPTPAMLRRDARRASKGLAVVERAAAAPVVPPMALGVVHGRGDLPPGWVQGKHLVLPDRVAGLPRLVIGRPGQGKSVYLCREVFLAGAAHTQAVVVDCKGEAGFADEVEAAYRAGWEANPYHQGGGGDKDYPTVHRWPDEPLNAWTGGPEAVANRLLSVWTFDLAALWYREVVDMALNLAMLAPGDAVASSREVLQRVQPGTLAGLWQGHPEEEALVKSLGNKLDDVNIRLGNLLTKLGGLLDGTRAIGQADLAILSLPTMGQEHQAESILRVTLADLAHYVAQRKPAGRRLLVVVDEWSAIPGGREHAIHLSERGRSALAAVVLAVQSARGLGSDEDADRLIGGAGMVAVFGTAEPERILRLAGTIRTSRWSTSLGDHGTTNTYTETEHDRVDANDVRALEPGFAYVLASGRAQRVKVLRPPQAGNDLALPGRPFAVASREVPGPVQSRQARRRPENGPAASELDPPGPGRVRRYRPPVPGGAEGASPTTDRANQGNP